MFAETSAGRSRQRRSTLSTRRTPTTNHEVGASWQGPSHATYVTDTLPTIIGGWLTQGGTVLRRSTTLVVTALVAGVLSAPSSAASATAQTCQGRPATIV